MRQSVFMLRALRHRNYRLFFSGQIVSLCGTWMTTTATSWLVYRLTGSAMLLGIVAFSSQLPAFIFSFAGGIAVDRHNRHQLLILTQTLSMIQSFFLAVLTLGHWITIPWILGLSAFQGIVNAFDMPCRQSFVLELIENKKDLGNAIALNSSIFNFARLLGPAIGGLVIATFGEGWCFMIDGVSYLAVIFALASMIVKPWMPGASKKESILKQFQDGWNYAFNSHAIRSILTLLALVSLMGVPYNIFMPIFAGTILHGGPHTLGFLLAAVGAGALGGALWLAARKTVLGLGRTIVVSTIIFSVGLAAFSFTRVLWLSLLTLVIVGCGFMIQVAASNTILQTIVEDNKRGRVMSFFIMAVMGTAPFGSLLAGSLSGKIGVPWTLFLCAVSSLLGAFWFSRQLPEIRKIIRPIYAKLGIIPEVNLGIETAAGLPLPE